MDAKFKEGDLVIYNNLLGRITKVEYNQIWNIWTYRIGTLNLDIAESNLQRADWRDEVCILKRNK